MDKITPQNRENFQFLMKQILDLEINTEERLSECVNIIFEKAIDEPAFSVERANMCKVMAVHMKVVPSTSPNKKVTFKKLLLNRCQTEFENDEAEAVKLHKMQQAVDRADTEHQKNLLTYDMELVESKAKHRSLGNIRFIGELFKLNMLTEHIIHNCIHTLIKATDEESLECLCLLITTVGKSLDQAKPLMDQYFLKFDKIIKLKQTSGRVCCMLQELQDLRLCKWKPRGDDKTIEQSHNEAAEDEVQKEALQPRLAQESKNMPRRENVMAKEKPNYKEFVEGQLECSVCIETVKDPQTLQGCFHSFCSTCLDQLLQKEGGPEPGVTCPVCRKFSRHDDIQANFVIKNLADMHLAHTDRMSCEQCPKEPLDASSKCLDCKMLLCELCKAAHLKVKLLQSHRILPLSEDTELIVDQLVFCSQHLDKPIELYCEQCKSGVCMMCTVTNHKGHDCQTIKDTLDKMVPQWEKNIVIIDEKITVINRSSDEVDKKIYETKSEYNRCADEIDRKTEQRIAEIKSTQNTMKQELRAREKEEVEKLEKVRTDLEEKRKDGQNVRRVVRTSLDRARHASLLAELLQEGLGNRARELMEWGAEVVGSATVSLPAVQGGNTVWEGVREGMLGRIVYHVASVLMSVGSVLAPKFHQQGSRQWNVDVREYSKKRWRQAHKFKVPIPTNVGESIHFTIVGEHIWLPMWDKAVNIYGKTGTLLKTLNVDSPKAVDMASNGDIFIACRNGSGVNVTTGADHKPQQISDGSWIDLCEHQGKMYTLFYGDKIKEYTFQDKANEEDIINRWKVSRDIKISNTDKNNTFTVHQPNLNEPVQFYVCEDKGVKEYNHQGQCKQTFSGLPNEAYICGVDNESNIILVSSTGFQALDTATGKITDLGTLGLDEVTKMYDARLDGDGSVWVLYQNKNGEHLISKQVPE